MVALLDLFLQMDVSLALEYAAVGTKSSEASSAGVIYEDFSASYMGCPSIIIYAI